MLLAKLILKHFFTFIWGILTWCGNSIDLNKEFVASKKKVNASCCENLELVPMLTFKIIYAAIQNLFKGKELILPKLRSCCQCGWNCCVNACAWTERETFLGFLCQELLLVFLCGSPKSCWFILVCLKMQMSSNSYTVARNIENSYPHTISLTQMPGWTLYRKSS